jgi:hypothetical protein
LYSKRMPRTGALHLVDARRQHERLARAQFFAHQREAEDAALEAVGEAREERRFLLIFEEVELADDEVALLAGAGSARRGWADDGADAAVGAHGLGIHAGDEQRVVADVLAQARSASNEGAVPWTGSAASIIISSSSSMGRPASSRTL